MLNIRVFQVILPDNGSGVKRYLLQSPHTVNRFSLQQQYEKTDGDEIALWSTLPRSLPQTLQRRREHKLTA